MTPKQTQKDMFLRVTKFSGHLWCFHYRKGPETLVVRFPRSWRDPWEEAALSSCDRRLMLSEIGEPPTALFMLFLPSLLWSSILMLVSGSVLCILASEVTSHVAFHLPYQAADSNILLPSWCIRDTFLKQDRDIARSSFLVTSFLKSNKALVENNPLLDAPQVVPHKSLECS